MVFGLILLSIAYDVWWQIENAVIGQSLPFVLGIVFAFSDLKWVKEKLNDFKKYILIIISFTIVFFVTFFIWSILRWHVKFPEYFISIIGIVCQNIFVLLIVLCAMGFISKSIIGKYIGKGSYEIFLLHQISIDIFQNLFGDANLSAVIIGSIVSSIAMGSIFHWIMKKVILLLLILFMCFALSACNSSQNAETTEKLPGIPFQKKVAAHNKMRMEIP